MRQSKTSAAQRPDSAGASHRPEFFLDRCLGKLVAEQLVANGWIVHRLADHFPDDGQKTSDPEWISYGVKHRWALLTQDLRIRYRRKEIDAVERGAGVMFQLSNGNLLIAEKVRWFLRNRSAIEAAVSRGGPALHRVYYDRISKIWPDARRA